jgi:hypothetical protein
VYQQEEQRVEGCMAKAMADFHINEGGGQGKTFIKEVSVMYILYSIV